MTKKPFLSIITVSYNNLSGLRKTLKSLPVPADQSYEWVVIDGASSDGTPEFLDKTHADWISEPDSGLYDAMNKGISRANGDYLIFLNAGDELADPTVPDILARHVRHAQTPPDFIYGDSYEGNVRTLKKAVSHTRNKWRMFTHHQAMIYKRKSLGLLRYDTRYSIAADYDLTCRFLQNADTVLYVPAPLCIFENGEVSQTNARTGRNEQFHIRNTLGITPLPINAGVYIAQTFTWIIKRQIPALSRKAKTLGVGSCGNTGTG